MNNQAEVFLQAMRSTLPEGDARVMLCQFRGDPYADQRGKWRAKVVNDSDIIDNQANVYFCVSAMGKNARGEYRRRKENFRGGLMLMIDDLGTGAAAKFPLSVLDVAPPSALIETSPDNFQAIYLFKEAVTDMLVFEALIRSFIDKEFLGKDTGMAGVNRVFRPPAGINGKPAAHGWAVRAVKLEPDLRYTVRELAQAYGLNLNVAAPPIPKGPTQNNVHNITRFVEVRSAFRAAGMIKREEPDVSGWFDVVCPWTDAHTAGADNGAAMRVPDYENGFTGAFKCHHGGCADRTWADVTQWLADESAEVLGLINQQSPKTLRGLLNDD